MIFNLIKVKRFYILLMVFVLFFSISIQYVAAIDTGLDTTAQKGYGGKDATVIPKGIPREIPGTIGKIVGAGLAFIGVLFLILMIYGGFTWMLARGNEQEITKAEDLIYSAVIGLVIVLAAYAITAYVGGIFKQ